MSNIFLVMLSLVTMVSKCVAYLKSVCLGWWLVLTICGNLSCWHFWIIAHFLANLTEKEIKFGGKEAFTRWRGHAAPFKAQYLGKFKAYPHHQYSFILPVDEKTGVFKWWEGLLGCISAMILPVQFFFFFFFFWSSATMANWWAYAVTMTASCN